MVDHGLADVISHGRRGWSGPGRRRRWRSLDVQWAHAIAPDAAILVASSGDDGAAQPSCDGESLIEAASTPASDPLVTLVPLLALRAG